MADLLLTEYWEKVVSDPSAKPWPTRVIRGEYDVKSRSVYSNGAGWGSWSEVLRNWKRRGYKVNTQEKTAIIDGGVYFGIHSYTVLEWKD